MFWAISVNGQSLVRCDGKSVVCLLNTCLCLGVLHYDNSEIIVLIQFLNYCKPFCCFLGGFYVKNNVPFSA